MYRATCSVEGHAAPNAKKQVHKKTLARLCPKPRQGHMFFLIR